MIIPVAGRKSLSLLEKTILKDHLNQGGILAFPTDTVYGLGVKPGPAEAVDRLYSLKKRDKKKPLILLGASLTQFEPFTSTEKLLHHPVLSAYWPGPLTVVVPFEKKSGLYFGHDNPQYIGMRIPRQDLLLDLLSYLGFPLLTTSANPSESVPLRSGSCIQQWLLSESSSNCIVLDNGTMEDLPSTVILLTENGPLDIIRAGVLSAEKLSPFFDT